MKAFEIFQKMNPETAVSVFQFLRNEQREVYSASLAALAANRKLRPVFIQRKPVAEQIAWLGRNVQLRGSDEVAEQTIQLWLLKENKELLVDFLDGLGIKHDGDGAADDIPEKLNAKKLKATVAKLLKDYDPERVRIYLHIFQTQSSKGWPELEKLVAETPELQFGVPEEKESAGATPQSEEGIEEVKKEAKSAKDGEPGEE